MKRIGLTGSIGSGKSTVAKLLAARGIPVLDADAVARQVSSRTDVLQAVSSQLGAEYVLSDGLNRAALAQLVFANPEARVILNSIIHPRVREEMARCETQLESEGARAVVQDIPLLFENNLQTLFDAVILVDAPLETRVARVMERDGATREAVLAGGIDLVLMDGDMPEPISSSRTMGMKQRWNGNSRVCWSNWNFS